MKAAKIRLMTERKYELIPIDKIRVLNSRRRDRDQFQENIRSIKEVGLLKPVVVNGRHQTRTGYYELVCGEGRYLAYKELGHTKIPVEVISCDRKTALLSSLVENIARVPPGTMLFAREIKRMYDEGWSVAQISKIVGRSDSYIRDYIALVEQGEDRLLKGVEQGLFNMSFALLVARSEDSAIQNVLMDAFDNGMVNSSNLPTVRRVIESRMKARENRGAGSLRGRGRRLPAYSVKQLRSDITKVTKEKEAFIHETSVKENRLITLLQDLGTLERSDAFTALLQAEGFDQGPKLKGTYAV